MLIKKYSQIWSTSENFTTFVLRYELSAGKWIFRSDFHELILILSVPYNFAVYI